MNISSRIVSLKFMHWLTLFGFASAALDYDEALQLLESTKIRKEETPKSLVGYFLDYLISPKVENHQGNFDWKIYQSAETNVLEPGDKSEIPAKAKAMLKLEACSITDSNCTKLIGDISLYGLYGIKQNATDAFFYYKQLSDSGVPAGHRQLGNLFATGLGTERNYAKALVYMSFAALRGDLLADQTLGYWHYAGIGMPKSCSKALWHYQRVADKSYFN